MAFKCLTCACTVLLAWSSAQGRRRKKEKRALTRLGGSYWGTVGSGAFGTHQRVTLAEFLNCFQSHLPVGRGPKEKGKRKGEWGLSHGESSPCTGHQMLRHSKHGLEKNFQTQSISEGSELIKNKEQR